MTHIDLFTGIGGFALAAQWTGFQTVVMCEIDNDLRYALKKIWKIPVAKDVRRFNGRRWQGATLLTAGVPCQPVSCAGKRKGKDDDRWLWPGTLRVIKDARPAWCLCENPSGIDGMGLGGIIAEMERIGYQVAVLSVPACAVNSPQKRERYWILAHDECAGQRRVSSHIANGRRAGKPKRGDSCGDVADGMCEQNNGRYEGRFQSLSARDNQNSSMANGNGIDGRGGTGRGDGAKVNYLSHWDDYEWIPCREPNGEVVYRRSKPGLVGLAHGIPARLRNTLIKGFGNAIVPQVAAEILAAIAQVEKEANQ